MTNTQGETLTKITVPTTPDIVQCPACGRVIGQYQQVGKQVWLNVGGLVMRDAYGSCVCGAPFIWHASDKQLSSLLARVKARAVGC